MSHQCSICGRKYEHKHTLARHVKKKHNNPPGIRNEGVPPYSCPTCGKKYEHRHLLAEHLKDEHQDVLHVDPTTVKPSRAWVKDATALISYTCLKCGRMFPSQQFLDKHIKEKGTNKSTR